MALVLLTAVLIAGGITSADSRGTITDDLEPTPATESRGMNDGPDGFPPSIDARRAEIVYVDPLPAPLPPVFAWHCATNLADCARAAGDACAGAGLGAAQSAQLAMCPRADGASEGCCTFTCGAQGGASTGSGTCRAG